MKKIVILSGAGISAESGLKTFRDAGGLWEGHDVMQVASPEGWRHDQDLVLEFYNQRRRQLNEVEPNEAHRCITRLQEWFDVEVVTQNVDDLHERAGNKNVTHLHGELLKVRSTKDERLVYPWTEDLRTGDLCELGGQLRPHIVWFGEAVPMMEVAADKVLQSDICIIVGTSMQVYPAAGLVDFVSPQAELFYIDPRPNLSYELRSRQNLRVLASRASEGLPLIVEELLKKER
jgi:NAD-dependent deacetylase